MAFRTNAEGKEQERAATRYAAHIGPRAEDSDYSVVFSSDGVLVIQDGEKFNFETDEFYRWVDAACPMDADGPIDLLPLEEADEGNLETGSAGGEGGPPVAATEPEMVADTGTGEGSLEGSGEAGDAGASVDEEVPEGAVPDVAVDDPEPEGAGDPSPRAERAIEEGNLRDAFHDLVRDTFEVLRQEHRGEIGRNVARLRKGQVMTVVEAFKERAQEEGLEGLTTTKDILAALNSGLIAFANSHGIVDRFNRITENEATITRTVFERFTQPERGINSTFRMVDAVDEATGEPILNDAGEPMEVPLSEVAVNNLYPLSEYVAEGNRDALASFAHRFSEKVVKQAKKYSKDRSVPILEVVQDINNLRRAVPSPITEEEVSVQADEGLALSWIREQRGEEPPSEIVSIVTTRDWYEAEFEAMKAVASKAYAVFGQPLDEETGLISNVKLLERTMTQYFSINLYGAERLIAALVDAGDFSEAQAQRFLARYQWDPEIRELVEQEVSEEEAQALTEAIATGEQPAEPEGPGEPDEWDEAFKEDLDLDVAVEPEREVAVAAETGGLDDDEDF